MIRPWLPCFALALALASAGAQAADYVRVPGAPFESALTSGEKGEAVGVGTFDLRATPVSNGEFAAFVRTHPQWRRDRVAPVFADPGYLTQWASADDPGDAAEAARPATQVSWFAAQAYCESEQARLPLWIEWELAAAADEKRRDARDDPAWRERILAWYARPSSAALPPVGGAANAYGARDLHGLVWEWVEDFNALMIDADSRNQGDPDRLRFCGAGALSMRDRDNYAVLMRIALLSSLSARSTTVNLGFRCARPPPKETP